MTKDAFHVIHKRAKVTSKPLEKLVANTKLSLHLFQVRLATSVLVSRGSSSDTEPWNPE